MKKIALVGAIALASVAIISQFVSQTDCNDSFEAWAECSDSERQETLVEQFINNGMSWSSPD